MAIARKARADGTTAYYVTRMVDGKRVWFPGAHATLEAARDADAELRQAKRKGAKPRPRRETVGAMVDGWLGAKATSGKHREQTQDLYRLVLRTRVPEAFMNMRAVDVQPDDVQAVVNALVERGLASGSVLKTHRILSAAFAYTVRKGRLVTNPCSAVELPKARRRKLRVPSGDKVGRILAASEGHPLHPVLVVLAYCGLRRSEALGLAWDDVAPDWTTLTIERAVAETEQGLTLEPTKTDAGQRQVPLHPVVVKVLNAHKARQNERRLALGPGWIDPLADRGGLVFDNVEGLTAENAKDRSLVIRPHRVTLYFRRLRDRLAMPEVRLHDLRHFGARTALDRGVPMHKVKKMLGHSRISTTVDIYGEAEDVTETTDAIGDGIAWGDR